MSKEPTVYDRTHYNECWRIHLGCAHQKINALEARIRERDAEIKRAKRQIEVLLAWKEGAEIVIDDLGAKYTGPECPELAGGATDG